MDNKLHMKISPTENWTPVFQMSGVGIYHYAIEECGSIQRKTRTCCFDYLMIIGKKYHIQYVVLDSIVVSIPACHEGDRGSIPRRGDTL